MQQPTPIHWGHVPFVRFLLALLAGIGTAYALPPHQSVYGVAWAVLGAASAAFLGVVWITRLRVYRYYGILGFLVLLALYALGWALTWQSHPEIDRSHFSHHEAEVLIGHVADEPVARGSRLRFPVAITKAYGETGFTAVSGQLMLTVDYGNDNQPLSIDYGDELIVPADYREVPPPYNPGEMDYRRYLANHNLWHQSYLSSSEVQQVAEGRGNPVLAYALDLRQRMVTKFSRYISDNDALAVASTLVLGYRADLSEELLAAFSTTGTIHILSVSGMHVLIVYWLLSKLLWWMDRGLYLRVAKFMVSLLAMWGYALLTGFSPSVLRASLMISFVMAAASFGQQNRIYNSIAASAFFLLLFNPKFIADIGFQLSYLAVLGIVFLLPYLQAAFPVRNRMAKPVFDYMGMSVAAQAGAGPLAAYHFHQFPLYFLPANLLIVLPASGIMYLGFALLILPGGRFASWIGELLEKLIVATNEVLGAIERLPMASVRGIWMTWWEELSVYTLLLAIPLAFATRGKGWVYGALGCVTLLVCSSFLSVLQRVGEQQVVLFNVRRNMAIGLIGDREAWLYSDLSSMDDRTVGYAVLPALEANVPAGAIRFVPQDSSYQGRGVYIRGGVVQFGGVRLMVYDGTTSYRGRLAVDILLLRNNPRLSIEALRETVSCKQLVLDGSNTDATIDRLKEEADAAGIPVYVLKNNLAFVWQDRVR